MAESAKTAVRVVDGSGADKAGRALGAIDLSRVDQHALALAERVQRARRDPNSAHCKRRAEVSGGGIKPWRQKGTGRARQGSIRAVQWRHGGVAWGPRSVKGECSLNRKQRRLATGSAVADKSLAGRLVLVEGTFPAEPKAKAARAFLEKLGAKGRVLLLLDEKEHDTRRAFRNLRGVRLMNAGRANALDIMSADYLLMSSAGAGRLEAMLAGKGEAKGKSEAEKAEE